MKNRTRNLFIALALLVLSTLNPQLSTAFAQGTAFTYQGRLNGTNGPATGSYDIAFTLFATNVTGSAVAGPVTNTAIAVTNGLFTTTVDFGNAYTGTSNWLELAVSTNGANAFSTLAPRQQLTPVPYAITAANVSGVVSYQNLPGFQNGNKYNALGGGLGNMFDGTYGWNTIAGGQNNEAGFEYSTVGGGYGNNASGYLSTVGGGANDWATGQYSYVGGGLEDKAYGDYSTVAGGNYNAAYGIGAFIGGGGTDGRNSTGNTANGSGSVIGGGVDNATGLVGTNAVVAGGYGNKANGIGSVIGGGGYDGVFYAGNTNNGAGAVIGGGVGNYIATNGLHSIISGGFSNYLADANYNYYSLGGSVIAGGDLNTIQNTGLDIGESTIGGGGNNTIMDADYGGSVIAGGQVNTITNYGVYGDSTIGGGSINTILDGYFGGSVIAGGDNNIIRFGTFTVISGGQGNRASGIGSVIGGGGNDGITSAGNTNNGAGAVIGGGVGNFISTNGYDSVIAGGAFNQAAGTNSFAAGNNAQATNNAAFVWGDGSVATGSFTNNSVTMRAINGFRFYSGTSSGTYAYLAPGSGSWTSLSDRNVKEHFQTVNAQDVLARVSALPVSTWNYKTQPADIRHIGPTAQDFKAAFAVGETDIGISVVDEGGVALAAIQGLNQKLSEKDAQIQQLQQSMDELKKMVQSLSGKK